MPTPTRLALASENAHKAEEMQAFFDAHLPSPIELVCVPHLHGLEETAKTFQGNAERKVLFCLEYHADWLDQERISFVLGDDSGYCVDALAGMDGLAEFPGVYSNRWLTPERYTMLCQKPAQQADRTTHAEKCEAILALMEDKTERQAWYVAALHLACRDTLQHHQVEGRCPLVMAHTPSGVNGFGYDPINHPVIDGQPLPITVAEWSLTDKNKFSHRSRALQRLVSLFKLPQACS